MSSNHNTTEVTNLDLSTTPATPLPEQRPFVMPKLVKQGKVATLTNDDVIGGASDIPIP